MSDCIPCIEGNYVNIYTPEGDIFPGPDTGRLKANTYYPIWVPNDHHILWGLDGCWHGFGITHPIISEHNHDGECLLFHVKSEPGNLYEVLKTGYWKDQKKVLPFYERPDETSSIHSPFIINHNNMYMMVYGPTPFRYAVSNDLYHWESKGNLFSDPLASGRDPMILKHNGLFYFIYCSNQYSVEARISDDFLNWKPPVTVFQGEIKKHPESPVLVYRNGIYYLFWCLWDQASPEGNRDIYPSRTYVYASKDPLHFKAGPITVLEAHAPEIIQDETGEWYITSAEKPCRGISIARLVWKEGKL